MVYGLIGRLAGAKNKSGRFICHIGPPKTATTTMQASLQEITDTSVRYLGTFQPRYLNEPSSIYSNIIKLTKKDAKKSEIYQVRRNISRELNSGIDLILSDEMFLINQGNIRFEDKLQRLESIIGQFNCLVSFTLREPVSGIRSLYTELYLRQGKLPKMSFENFILSDQARVFDYSYLLYTLEQCKFKNIRILRVPKQTCSLKLEEVTGNVKHKQFLNLSKMNETEDIFRAKVGALVIPEAIESRLSAGYAHALNLYDLQGS